MGIHQTRKHPEFVEGCYGCKLSTISFGTVPGGSRDAETNISYGLEVEKNLVRYEERKAAGEQPSGISTRAQERDARKRRLWENHGDSLADENDSETVAKVKRSLVNKE